MLRNIFSAAMLVVMLVVLVAGSVQAQSHATASVAATATVLTALTITNVSDVAFGNVSATTNGVVYLDPQGGANTYMAPTDGITVKVGALTIAGGNTKSIRLTWPLTVSMAGGSPITYTLKVTGLNANTQGSSGLLTLGGSYIDVTTSATGDYYLWVGGNLGTLSSATPGAYTGSANFTVEYN